MQVLFHPLTIVLHGAYCKLCHVAGEKLVSLKRHLLPSKFGCTEIGMSLAMYTINQFIIYISSCKIIDWYSKENVYEHILSSIATSVPTFTPEVAID